MNIVLSGYVVRFSDGSIDHEATVAKFSNDLIDFENRQNSENGTIGAVLHGIFDKHLGKRIPMPYVVTEALKALNVQPDNFQALTEKVENFARNSPEFSIAKGRGGGVGRVKDLPSK